MCFTVLIVLEHYYSFKAEHTCTMSHTHCGHFTCFTGLLVFSSVSNVILCYKDLLRSNIKYELFLSARINKTWKIGPTNQIFHHNLEEFKEQMKKPLPCLFRAAFLVSIPDGVPACLPRQDHVGEKPSLLDSLQLGLH